MNYFVEMYATDEVVTETETKMKNFKQQQSMTLDQYSGALWTTSMSCIQAYKKYVLKGIFAEILPDIICNSLRPY